MNNEPVKMFRSALGGFHREDVINYIKEIDQKHADEIKEITDQLETKKLETQKLLQQLEELERLRTENTSLKQQITELSRQFENAEQELLTEREKTGILTESLMKTEMRINELEEKIAISNKSDIADDPNDHDSPAYKLAMYDKISSQLGDILINANRNADDIMTVAREEAEKLRADAEIECTERRAKCEEEIAHTKAKTLEETTYIRERLAGTADSLLLAIGENLHGNMENCIREMNSCIVDMQYELQAMLSKISSRSGEMNDRISYYQGCVGDEVKKKLDGMVAEFDLGQGVECVKQADGASIL